MALLCNRALDTLESRDQTAVEDALEAQRRFLKEHLLRWAADCLGSVEAKRGDGILPGRGCPRTRSPGPRRLVVTTGATVLQGPGDTATSLEGPEGTNNDKDDLTSLLRWLADQPDHPNVGLVCSHKAGPVWAPTDTFVGQLAGCR